MAKNIVFCADGTWNAAVESNDSDACPTNVLKCFAALEGINSGSESEPEQEKRLLGADGKVVQVAKYLHGVGDSWNPIMKVLGGVFGAGQVARIVRGYTFVSRSYEPGDKIFILGFSRGAYTARAIAGMIDALGVLNAKAVNLEDRDLAYELGSAAWFRYRANSKAEGVLARLGEFLDELPLLQGKDLKPDYFAKVDVECVGVWDTVGAMGIPQYTGQSSRIDTFRFANTALGACVKRGLHAVALDEQRADFSPTLWDSDRRISQLLFAGAHTDVGGGNSLSNGESTLSDVAYEWMRGELSSLGLQFHQGDFPVSPDPLGMAHEPWTDGVFSMLPQSLRQFDQSLEVHPALLHRIAKPVPVEGKGVQIYCPLNLPQYAEACGALKLPAAQEAIV